MKEEKQFPKTVRCCASKIIGLNLGNKIFEITEEIKKDTISRHVQGEIDMFYFCYKKLIGDLENIGGNEKRMAHECFLLHTRNLIDFLWPPLSSKPDDVLANCFTDFDISDNNEINHVRIRINKQLSHITFCRSSKEQEDLLPKTRVIYQDVVEALKTYNNACSDKEYKLAFPNIQC